MTVMMPSLASACNSSGTGWLDIGNRSRPLALRWNGWRSALAALKHDLSTAGWSWKPTEPGVCRPAPSSCADGRRAYHFVAEELGRITTPDAILSGRMKPARICHPEDPQQNRSWWQYCAAIAGLAIWKNSADDVYLILAPAMANIMAGNESIQYRPQPPNGGVIFH